MLFIDIAEVDVALGNMKKSVGERFASIVWNGGKGPEVNKDEALGLTATFDNGVAEDKGTKYAVNFVQYVRKSGKKFMLLLCQNPLTALDKHGDALTQVVRSIKVK